MDDLYIKSIGTPQFPPEIEGRWFTIWFDNSPRARFRRFIKRIIHRIKPVHYTFVMPTERQEFFIPYLEGCGFHKDEGKE